jgi:hypothetical protein
MGKTRYEGARLYSLLNDTWDDFHRKYPGVKYNTYKGKRAYWKQKIKEGKITMPSPESLGVPEHQGNNFEDILRLHNVSPELANELTEKGFHVGYIKNKEGEIEYTIPLPHARGSGSKDMSEFTPASPARITPSRRKPEKRDHKVLYVFSDAQVDYRRMEDGELIPIHDERALVVGRMICKDVMPDEIINLGDTVDLAALSRFKPDSDHFHRTLGPSFQRVHDYYAELLADSPWAKVVEVDSNHNTRLKDFMLKNAPDLYGFRRPGDTDKYPMFTYPYMANLGHLGVEWISGYGAAEYIYGAEYDKPPIIFKHGKSSVSGGSTAAKESRENPYNHVVRGHSHKIEGAYRTTRQGEYLGSFVVGAACRITGEVPSYHSAVDDEGEVVKYQENWQQGVMVIRDYEGEYDFDQIPIRDGKAWYQGKEYDAN